jgi:uncharacterized protein
MLQCKKKDSSVKFERDAPDGRNTFTGYGPGYVEVNGKRYSSSLVVSAERLIVDWPAASVDALAAILELAPEVAIIGSGSTFRLPEPARLAPLHQARIGVEVMDTAAACRTYNILQGEGRNVVAALIVTPAS